MSEARKRAFGVINTDRAGDLREISDIRLKYCVPASVAETAALISDKGIPRAKQMVEVANKIADRDSRERGVSQSQTLITEVDELADLMGIKVDHVYLTTESENLLAIPENVKKTIVDKTTSVKGKAFVKMLLPTDEESTEDGHVECDSTLRGKERIALNKQEGMKDGALIGFRKKRTGLFKTFFGE